MKVTGLEAALDAISRGLFSEALAELEMNPPRQGSATVTLYDVVLAETLQVTGEVTKAETIARKVLRSCTERNFQSRCHSVLARIAVDKGDIRTASSHFNKALRLAAECDDVEQVCRIQITLVGAFSDDSSRRIAVTIRELRRNLARFPHPHLLAHLHGCLARSEAVRGSYAVAWSHLARAKSLLIRHPNVWLEGLVALQSSALATVTSQLRMALAFANEAKELAERSGRAFARAAAVGNIGSLRAELGEIEDAEHSLQESLRLAEGRGAWQILALDDMANIALLRGHLQECESLLRRVGQLPVEEPHSTSWNKLWNYQTRIRFCRAQDRWADVVDLSDKALLIAERRADKLMSTLARVLKSDGLFGLGDVPTASALLTEAELLYDGSSPHVRVELERVVGNGFTCVGDFPRAWRHFERALRMLTVSESVYLRKDVVHDYFRSLHKGGVIAAGIPCPCDNVEQLAKVPNPIAVSFSTAELAFSAVESVANNASDVALLFELAQHPLLFAREVFQLFATITRGRNLALIAFKNGCPAQILATVGWTAEEARNAAQSKAGYEQVFVGEGPGNRFCLLAEPAPDLDSCVTSIALNKLVSAALALEGFRERERQRAALWPFEIDAAAAEDGLYISTEMIDILATARKIAPSDLPVLLTGETGTGKELLARAIHRHSGRASKPFVPFNCKAVPRDLLDSQLFGHRRGAFTGAQEPFGGVIRGAAGGTLFLDEIGELDLDVQPKLLRFLETNEIHPLGEPQPLKVDVRVIAATNAKIDDLVSAGRFREDLFYRLNVLRFHLPPLRARREEIPPLLQHFLQLYGAPAGKHNIRFSDEATEYLLLYAWPGNVRQLANEVRRLVALVEQNAVLTPEDLSPEIRASRRTIAVANTDTLDGTVPGIFVRLDQPLGAAVEQVERALIAHALDNTDGQVAQAAERLGISRKGLFLKRRRFGFMAPNAA